MKRSLLLFTIIASTKLQALEFSQPVIIQSDGGNRSLNNTSSNVEVLTKEEIQKYQNLNELLKFESSLYVTSSGPKGSMSSVFLRGTDSSHTVLSLIHI